MARTKLTGWHGTDTTGARDIVTGRRELVLEDRVRGCAGWSGGIWGECERGDGLLGGPHGKSGVWPTRIHR
jgi:hypothetical protein